MLMLNISRNGNLAQNPELIEICHCHDILKSINNRNCYTIFLHWWIKNLITKMKNINFHRKYVLFIVTDHIFKENWFVHYQYRAKYRTEAL